MPMVGSLVGMTDASQGIVSGSPVTIIALYLQCGRRRDDLFPS
jgi:hypothetical protein